MIWNEHIKPFKIWGQLYFVGTVSASSHLIATEEGLILLDTGYQESLYLLINNIWELGFSPYDIKYILHTHGHIDHMGATRALVELTGAKTFIGEQDKDYVNGKLPLSYAEELGMEFKEVFEPDVLLHDEDVIELGGVKITCVATPGHTPGAMTYFFDVTEQGTTYRAALHGGMGVNTMGAWYLDKYKLSYKCRENFMMAMDRLNKEQVDIFLGNHQQHSTTLIKKRMLDNGYKTAFVRPEEWQSYNEFCKNNLGNMIREEERANSCV